MAASVRIDDEAFSDRRYDVLAKHLGVPNADCARGMMASIWRQCTQQQAHVLDAQLVRAILGDNGPESLVIARLGEVVEAGIRIYGTRGRIEWLAKLRKNARKGGVARSAKWHPKGSPDGTQTRPKRDPKSSPPTTASVPASDSATAEVQEKNSAAPSAGGDSPPIPIRRKPKPSEPTPAERESAVRVLGKLTERNEVRYSGTDEHVRLIVRHLRNGLDELDLRKVIGYCASELEWATDPDMAKYLRPETLFGPQTFSKYLDPARTWYDKLQDGAA